MTTLKKTFFGDFFMRRLFLGLVIVAALAACNDSTPTGTRASGRELRVRATEVTPTGTLDEEIRLILGFWPPKPRNDLIAKWDAIVKKYNEQGTNPKALQDAIKKLYEFSKQIVKVTDKMGEPTTGESKEAAAARLIEYMNLYVFGGPDTDPPPYDPDAETAVGFLTPGAPLTLVTSGGGAGVHFDQGSVNENRTIVVTENPNQAYGTCEGPLKTKLCQFALYIDIASYPDGPLLKLAQAEVCHPEVGLTGGPPDAATHNRLRLAHTKPSDPANYVPGGIIREDPVSEEDIEILPLITQTFLPSCEGIEYEGPGEIGENLFEQGVRLASRVARRVGRLLTPRSAYAIDQGGGGSFGDFSPFNNVDPASGPLYATDGNSGNLLRVNTYTGAGTIVGSMGTGVMPALAADPTTAIIYAGHGGGTPTIYTVNPTTGAATLIGDSGLGWAAISSLAFRSDGVLFAAVNIAGDGGTGADHLATINKTTGIATVLGPFGTCTGVVQPAPFPTTGSCSIEGIEGIAFDASGTLWGSHSARGAAGAAGLYTVNTTTGAATFSNAIVDGSSNPPSGGIVSLVFGINGTLYGGTARALGEASDGGKLVSIDPTTGVFTPIGATTALGSSLSGLTFR
jgi:hypothetical protein